MIPKVVDIKYNIYADLIKLAVSQIELDEGGRMMNLCSVGQWSFLFDDKHTFLG